MTFPMTEDLQLVQVRANRKPHDYRCRADSCGRLLFRAVIQPGCYIEIRCPKCSRMSVFSFEPSDNDYVLVDDGYNKIAVKSNGKDDNKNQSPAANG